MLGASQSCNAAPSSRPNRIYAKVSTIDGKPKSFHALKEGNKVTRNYRPEDGESRKFYDTCELESLCVSRFRGNRRDENEIYDTTTLWADIDCNGDMERILGACDMIGLPREWLTIITTSNDDRLHVLIPLKSGFRTDQKSFLVVLQKQLDEFLGACGCVTDQGVTCDRLRMLSNPEAVNARNYKYPNSPAKKVIQIGSGEATGSELYKIFKSCGWGKQPKKTKKKKIPISQSIRITQQYIDKKGQIECTCKELAEQLGIPARTMEVILPILRKHSLIEIRRVGNNKAGNMRRSVVRSLSKKLSFSEYDKKKYLKDTGGRSFQGNKNKGLVLEEYKGKIVKIGERNNFVFVATSELVYFRKFVRDVDKILEFLIHSYKIEQLGETFTEKEMRECIKSALNTRYVRPPGWKTLIKWGLLPESYPEPQVETATPKPQTASDSAPAIQANVQNCNTPPNPIAIPERPLHDPCHISLPGAVSDALTASVSTCGEPNRGPPH